MRPPISAPSLTRPRVVLLQNPGSRTHTYRGTTAGRGSGGRGRCSLRLVAAPERGRTSARLTTARASSLSPSWSTSARLMLRESTTLSPDTATRVHHGECTREAVAGVRRLPVRASATGGDAASAGWCRQEVPGRAERVSATRRTAPVDWWIVSARSAGSRLDPAAARLRAAPLQLDVGPESRGSGSGVGVA